MAYQRKEVEKPSVRECINGIRRLIFSCSASDASWLVRNFDPQFQNVLLASLGSDSPMRSAIELQVAHGKLKQFSGTGLDPMAKRHHARRPLPDKESIAVCTEIERPEQTDQKISHRAIDMLNEAPLHILLNVPTLSPIVAARIVSFRNRQHYRDHKDVLSRLKDLNSADIASLNIAAIQFRM